MILQQSVNGIRRAQKIFVPDNVVVGRLLPVSYNIDGEPTQDSPNFFFTEKGEVVQWIRVK